MRVQASVGRGAKKTDSICNRVGKLTLTAELDYQPYDEFGLLARLLHQIDDVGLRGVVEATEAAFQ